MKSRTAEQASIGTTKASPGVAVLRSTLAKELAHRRALSMANLDQLYGTMFEVIDAADAALCSGSSDDGRARSQVCASVVDIDERVHDAIAEARVDLSWELNSLPSIHEAFIRLRAQALEYFLPEDAQNDIAVALTRTLLRDLRQGNLPADSHCAATDDGDARDALIPETS